MKLPQSKIGCNAPIFASPLKTRGPRLLTKLSDKRKLAGVLTDCFHIEYGRNCILPKSRKKRKNS